MGRRTTLMMILVDTVFTARDTRASLFAFAFESNASLARSLSSFADAHANRETAFFGPSHVEHSRAHTREGVVLSSVDENDR